MNEEKARSYWTDKITAISLTISDKMLYPCQDLCRSERLVSKKRMQVMLYVISPICNEAAGYKHKEEN